MLNFITDRLREREITRELSRLSDRSLEDLGIMRWEIPAVARGASRPAPAPRAIAPAEHLAPAWGAHLRRSAA